MEQPTVYEKIDLDFESIFDFEFIPLWENFVSKGRQCQGQFTLATFDAISSALSSFSGYKSA